ncbi:MAG: hypothetical protein EKK61_03155 [Rickettsiales bacterium]|nr:MAG: hypothetical protein EKK61_03155 [Rickettsiales bacterium]
MDNQEEIVEVKPKIIEIPRSETEDTIDMVYTIHLNEEIAELSNDFCKYYNVINTATNEEFYGIIYDNKFLHPIEYIDSLNNHDVPFLNQIIRYAIIKLSTSKEERLAVIVPKYDPDNNLANYILKGLTISTAQFEIIIDKMIKLFNHLSELKIFCYDINPQNILMHDGEFLKIKEFINSYPYFFQKNQYLAPEIIEAHQAARFLQSNTADIYALGITMFEAYTGKSFWNDYETNDAYNNARFENTTSKFLLSKVKIPEKLKVFFKWTLHDEANARWNLILLKDWIDGKITKLSHELISDNKNTIGFNDNIYSSPKSIVYALFKNWHEASRFIRDNKLFKWASREQISNESLEQIKSMVDVKQDTSFIVVSSANSHIKIPKILAVLDSNGCIRQENIAFTAASIPIFLHYLISNNKRELAEYVVKLMKEEVWILYNKNPIAAGYLEKTVAEKYKYAASYIQIGSSIKNLKKLSYSLNSYMHCDSSILQNLYITSIRELLVGLNKIAQNQYKKFHIDRNIMSYITAKLNLKDDLRSTILSNFPKFVDNPTLNALNMLNILQQYEPDIDVTNITKMFVKDLKELFQDCLHNVEFKKKILVQLDEVANEGQFDKIIKIFSNQQQFLNDYNGYYEACRQIKIIEQNITMINDEDSNFVTAMLIGQKATVLLSYIMCFIVTVAVII